MQSLAAFCCVMLLLVEEPLGGTCEDHGTASSYECGPADQAVCCEDKVHCCPAGSQCDVQRSICVSQEDGKATPMWDKPPADWENQPAHIACDDKVHCKGGTTCCKSAKGTWSCCPLPEAVCCSDLKHCCPRGHTCNLAAQTCDLEWRSVPWLEKEAAAPRLREKEVRCDSKHTCADSSTCCRTKTGAWGCCPLPQAVCCPDGNHCCPTDYTCDEQLAKCVKKDVTVPWYLKLPASASSALPQQTLAAAVKPMFVQCDDESLCKDGQTCCKISPTDWGCCPLANAVCCLDMKHCCMVDYTCTASGQCIMNELP
ncbi:granulin a [Phycodurus eques]|uniref:granulin a n=1 Tax=Phycodurus eques TaxID=693459 RepID=UPI002ACD3324|nr:granulin a [Phycodurus eques]